MEKKSLKEKEAKLLGGLLHTQVDQLFIWRTTFYFLFCGLPFTLLFWGYCLPSYQYFIYPGFIMYCWQHVNWLKFSDILPNVRIRDELLGWFHHNDICWPILEPIVGLPGGADRKTGRQDQLCLFKVLVRQWLQLCQVPFGGIWFKTPSHRCGPLPNSSLLLSSSSSVGLTGQRGRQGRDRANLLAPVNRYLSK